MMFTPQNISMPSITASSPYGARPMDRTIGAFVPLIAPFKCAKPLNQVPNCIVSAHTFIWSSDNDFPISGPTNDSSIARNPFIMNATCVFTIIAYHPTAVGGTNPKRHDTRH
jgi:hypothetical protein